METPDRPSVEHPDNPESERLIDTFGIQSQLWRINRSLGIQIERPDEDATKEELDAWEDRMLYITLYTTFNEFSVGNEIFWRMKAVQHESTIQEILGTNTDINQLSEEDLVTLDRERRELVVANNGMTYNEYLPAIINQTVAFMDLYLQEFQQVLPSLTSEQREHLQEQYRQSVEYLYFLKRAIDERRNIANIYNLNYQINQLNIELTREDLNSDERESLEERGEQYRIARNQTYDMLNPESKEHMDEVMSLYEEWERTQNPELLQEYAALRGGYMDELDSDLLEILKGNPEGREDLGVEQNFLPQRIYLQIIQLRYNQLRDIQIQISTIEDWTDQDRAAAQEELNGLRRSYMDAMVMVTQQLAGHHVVMAELTTIQNQFGNDFNLTDAGNSPETRTSQHVVERIEDSIDGAKDFHLERLQAMLTQVDRSFNPNGQDELIDFGVMTAVEIVDWLSQGVRDLITVAIPEGETRDSIDGWIDEVMPLAIQESLESGVGPDGEPITKEEKLEKIRDVIIRFRETNAVEQYQTTVTLLQGMPDASRFVGEQLVDPLPEEEIRTAADRDRLIDEYNGATVYTMLIRQMKNDCEVFDEAYADFLGDMEDLVDIRLGLVAELNTIKEGWKRFAWTMLGAAGGAAVSSWIAAAVGGGLALNIAWRVAKVPLRLLSGGGSAAAPVAAAMSPTTSAVLTAEELAAANAPNMGRIGRAAAGAYFINEAINNYQELQRVSASIETQRTEMISDLLSSGFEESPPGQQEIFIYIDGGTEIKVNLGEINDAQRGQEDALAFGTVANSAALLALKLAPSNPVVIAIAITVKAITYGIDQAADRRFILRSPPWVLAKLNMEEATGDTAYDILSKASGTMISDFNPFDEAVGSQENRAERSEMRDKMLFAILNTELRDFPELRNEVYGNSDHAVFLDLFYNNEDGGFRDLFLPVFYSRLFELTSNGLSWEEVSRGQIENDWHIPLPTIPSIAQSDLRRAMRETIVFYIQHRREEQYLSAITEMNRIQTEIDNLGDIESEESHQLRMELEVLQDIISSLGDQEVFGQRLGDINEDDIALLQDEGNTRAQIIAEHLYSGSENHMFNVSSDSVHGLPEDFSFGEPGEIYAMYSDDPAFLHAMDSIAPRSIRELEGSTDPEWVYHFLNPILGENPLGMTEREEWRDKSMHAATQAATRLDDSAPELNDSMSEQQIQIAITQIGALIASSNRTSRTQYNLQRREYGHRPIFRSSGTGRDVYMRSINGIEGFESRNEIARFTESFRTENSGHISLATYIYGDPTNIDAMYVAQQANVTADMVPVVSSGRMMSSTELYRECERTGMSPFETIYGHPITMSARDFMEQQPGGREILFAATDEFSEVLEERRLLARSEEASREQEEERIRTREEEMNDHEIVAANLDNLRQESDTESFTSLEDRWGDQAYYLRYTREEDNRDYLISLDNHTVYGQQMFERPDPRRTGIFNPSYEIKFQIEDTGNTWTVRSDNFMDQEDISDADDRMIFNVITTPIPHDPTLSLANIINMFSYEVTSSTRVTNPFTEGFDQPLTRKTYYFHNSKLFNGLLPIYKGIETYSGKRDFLRRLLRFTRQRGGVIDEETTEGLIEYFEGHREDFE